MPINVRLFEKTKVNCSTDFPSIFFSVIFVKFFYCHIVEDYGKDFTDLTRRNLFQV